MKKEKTNIRKIILATFAAGLLIVSSGAGFRVLAARLASPVNTLVMSSEDLQRLPLQIGDWTGQDVAMDEAIVRATDTDALVNRKYFCKSTLDGVGLYIAYGARARDLEPHRPEVCYIGSGWTLVDKQSMELTANNDLKLPCGILQFSRGALNTEKVIVLDYYIVDSQYSSDVSLLRSKAWLGSGTIKYVAQIQIVAAFVENREKDTQIKNVCKFAIESASLISDLFEKGQKDILSDGNTVASGCNG